MPPAPPAPPAPPPRPAAAPSVAAAAWACVTAGESSTPDRLLVGGVGAIVGSGACGMCGACGMMCDGIVPAAAACAASSADASSAAAAPCCGAQPCCSGGCCDAAAGIAAAAATAAAMAAACALAAAAPPPPPPPTPRSVDAVGGAISGRGGALAALSIDANSSALTPLLAAAAAAAAAADAPGIIEKPPARPAAASALPAAPASPAPATALAAGAAAAATIAEVAAAAAAASAALAAACSRCCWRLECGVTAQRKKPGRPDESSSGLAEMEQRKGTDLREYETSITRSDCPADIASPSAASVSRQVSGPFLRGRADGERSGLEACGHGLRQTRGSGAARSSSLWSWSHPQVLLVPATAAAAWIHPAGGRRLTLRSHRRLTELPTTSSEL